MLCSARFLYKLIFPSNDHFFQTRWFIVRSPFIREWNWVCCNSVYLSIYLISGCLNSFQVAFLLKHRLRAVSGLEGLFYAPSGVCVGTGADQNGLWTLWTCHHRFVNCPSATLYTASANRTVAQMMLYWCINRARHMKQASTNMLTNKSTRKTYRVWVIVGIKHGCLFHIFCAFSIRGYRLRKFSLFHIETLNM